MLGEASPAQEPTVVNLAHVPKKAAKRKREDLYQDSPHKIDPRANEKHRRVNSGACQIIGYWGSNNNINSNSNNSNNSNNNNNGNGIVVGAGSDGYYGSNSNNNNNNNNNDNNNISDNNVLAWYITNQSDTNQRIIKRQFLPGHIDCHASACNDSTTSKVYLFTTEEVHITGEARISLNSNTGRTPSVAIPICLGYYNKALRQAKKHHPFMPSLDLMVHLIIDKPVQISDIAPKHWEQESDTHTLVIGYETKQAPKGKRRKKPFKIIDCDDFSEDIRDSTMDLGNDKTYNECMCFMFRFSCVSYVFTTVVYFSIVFGL